MLKVGFISVRALVDYNEGSFLYVLSEPILCSTFVSQIWKFSMNTQPWDVNGCIEQSLTLMDQHRE